MPINFPSNPANNQTYSYSGQSWYWANNYGVWQANTTVVGYTGSTGTATESVSTLLLMGA